MHHEAYNEKVSSCREEKCYSVKGYSASAAREWEMENWVHLCEQEHLRGKHEEK